jgi:hypothetical protein
LFENLKGRGKPLVFEDETWIPEDLRLAYRILKNANFIPPEIELKKEIQNLRDLISTLDDDKARLRKLREMNYKIMKFNMMRNAPLNLESFPEYENRVIDKLIQ